MGEYLRATRECTPASMSPAPAIAIRTHIEKHELGDVEKSVLVCVEAILKAGHEIAHHSYAHVDPSEQTPAQEREDMERAMWKSGRPSSTGCTPM